MTPEAERTALKDLLESDGWAIFMRHMSEVWGHEACERAMREARKVCAPEEWPFESTRILDSFAGMRANVKWPEERVRELSDPVKAKTDVFAKFRRGVPA